MNRPGLRNGLALLLVALVALGCAGNRTHTNAGNDIELLELTEGIWLHRSHYVYPTGHRFSSNGLVVKDGDELTLIDTAWGELKTQELLIAIAAETGLPVTQAIVTHSHGDRVSGVDVLKRHGVAVYAHPLTQRLTIEYGLPVPDRVFADLLHDEAVTRFGNLEVIYPGPAHTPDNLMVWLPEQRILFGGCAVRARGSVSLGNTSQADIGSWLRVLEFVAERYESAKRIIPGHGEPGGQEIIRHTHRLAREAAG